MLPQADSVLATSRPSRRRTTSWLAILLLVAAPSTGFAVEQVRPDVLGFLPHDTDAFTQGLLLHNGLFYESTGLYNESTLRRVDFTSGIPQLQISLPFNEFGEGLARVGNKLIQLTWRENTAYVYDIDDFSVLDTYTYSGEGWGLCHDGQRLIMSNGSSYLTYRDPLDFEILGQVQVTMDGVPISNLNELECVGSLVYANVWLTDTILRIDADTGIVLTEINASGLLSPQEAAEADVLNGIAFDPATDHFYLTGKRWPKVFEVSFPLVSGDFDEDGDVDGADLLHWQLNDGSESDLDIWQAAFGDVANPLAAASTGVPEPTAGLLLMLGMASLLFRRHLEASSFPFLGNTNNPHRLTGLWSPV